MSKEAVLDDGASGAPSKPEPARAPTGNGSSMSSLRTVRLALVGMFLLGTLSGVGLGHILAARRTIDTFDAAERGSRHGVFLWSLERKLDLSDEQLKRIETILASYDVEIGRATEPVHPEVQAIRAELRRNIREVLEPHQRDSFDHWMDQLDAVREKARKGTKE